MVEQPGADLIMSDTEEIPLPSGMNVPPVHDLATRRVVRPESGYTLVPVLYSLCCVPEILHPTQPLITVWMAGWLWVQPYVRWTCPCY